MPRGGPPPCAWTSLGVKPHGSVLAHAWLRANRAHACSALPLGEASLLCPNGLAAARVSRGVCHGGGPFWGCPKGQNAARCSNTGKTVLWGRPCLALRPVRAIAFGQGVRGTALGGVRRGNAARFANTAKTVLWGSRGRAREGGRAGWGRGREEGWGGREGGRVRVRERESAGRSSSSSPA